MSLGSQDSFQPDLVPARPARFPLLGRLHTTTQMEKNFAFLREKLFLKNLMKNLVYDDHKTILCWLKYGLDSNIRRESNTRSLLGVYVSLKE
jgi:hypothetical protein